MARNAFLERLVAFEGHPADHFHGTRWSAVISAAITEALRGKFEHKPRQAAKFTLLRANTIHITSRYRDLSRENACHDRYARWLFPPWVQ